MLVSALATYIIFHCYLSPGFRIRYKIGLGGGDSLSWSEVLAGQYEIVPQVCGLGVIGVRLLLEGEGREGGVEQGGGAGVEKEGDEVQVKVLVGETKVVQDRRDEVEVGCWENWGGCVGPCLCVHASRCACDQL